MGADLNFWKLFDYGKIGKYESFENRNREEVIN